MTRAIDLDANATTVPTPGVVGAVVRALMELPHNPSSVHRAGQAARHAVEIARRQLADLIGAKPRDVVLTGSGTEAIDLAVRGTLATRRMDSQLPLLVTTRTEHSAVRELAESLVLEGRCRVEWLPLANGVVDLSALGEVLERRPWLVSVQWANNETGIVQPVEAIAELCREVGVLLHCDGTQWVGKNPVSFANGLPFDLLSFSPHKFHGPKGVGVLYVRRGVRFRPTLVGSQELGRRGGTENVPGIVGAGQAAAEAASWLAGNKGDESGIVQGTRLRDRFERAVLARCPGSVINGGGGTRLWNTSNIAFPRLEAEAMLLALSERGVWASAGAACSSGSLEPSPVLLAMGIDPELAHGSLRFSLSRLTTEEEVDAAAAAVADVAIAQYASAGGILIRPGEKRSSPPASS